MKHSRIIVSALMLCASAYFAVCSQISTFNTTMADCWADSVMSTLNQRQRVAQLFVAKVSPEAGDAERQRQLQAIVVRENVGGLILEEGTAQQFVDILNLANSLARTPLLITVDGEWGVAMRVRDAVPYPRNMALGAINDSRLMYEYGKEVGRQCRALGIHVNFAPVLDVNTNPLNPVIGLRSFGESVSCVQSNGIAFACGMESEGVMSVAKHFPGHGSTIADSHKSLPMVDKSYAEYSKVDISPFKSYIGAGLSGILTAHLLLPSVDANNATSMSTKVVDTLLKRNLGFRGLVFTDALDMKGAVGGGSPAVNAFKAGNDVLLQPAELTKAIDDMMTALEKGEITMTQVDNACRKVLRYKYLLGADHRRQLDVQQVMETLHSADAVAMQHKLSMRAITVVKNSGGLLPISELGNVVMMGNDKRFKTFADYCRLYADVHSGDDIDVASTVIVPIMKEDNGKALAQAVASSRRVVAVLFASAYQASRYSELLNHDNVSLVVAYEDGELAQQYAAQALFGGIDVNATLPVSIPYVAPSGSGFSYKASRLGYTVAECADVDSRLLEFVDSIACAGVSSGAFPGCQVLMARHGKVFCNRNYGYTDPDEKHPVTSATVYDLASVSKAMGTLPGIMRAFDEGLIAINRPIDDYIPEVRGTDKAKITVKELLFHESGIVPALNLYDIMLDHDSYTGTLFSKRRDARHKIYVYRNLYGNQRAKMRTDIVSRHSSDEFPIEICRGIYGSKVTYDTLMQRIYSSKLRPTKQYAYSCLNFCTLMRIEENVTGIGHDAYVADIYRKLGAFRIAYRPREHFADDDIAPTELDNMLRRQKMHGYVHDELACFSGGMQGNAGLFGCANDLAKMCQMWLQGGEYGGIRVLKQSTVDLFTTTKSPTCRRGLGFDKPDAENPENSPTCSCADASVFGHLGFTGTVFWVDPRNDMVFVFLCNRVDPSRSNAAFDELEIRPRLFEAFYRNLR